MKGKFFLYFLMFIFPLSSYVAAAQSGNARAIDVCRTPIIPVNAKRKPTHGLDFFVYPAEVGPEYTGCQAVWLQDGTRLMTAYYKNGSVRWSTSKEPKGKSTVCLYKDGALVASKSSSSGCPSPDAFPF
jgi:hypothetical protein